MRVVPRRCVKHNVAVHPLQVEYALLALAEERHVHIINHTSRRSIHCQQSETIEKRERVGLAVMCAALHLGVKAAREICDLSVGAVRGVDVVEGEEHTG